jgi:hypothetical protein
MNIFKNLLNNIINIINNNINIITVITLSLPLYYANYICSNTSLSYTINNVYLYYLYSNKNIVINYVTNNSYYDSLIFSDTNIIYTFFYIVPLIYELFINKDLLQSIRITSIYTYEIINNKDIILNITSNLIYRISLLIFLTLLDYVLYMKMYIINYYKSFLNHNFIVTKVELYTDLYYKIDVTKYFKKNKIDKIDKTLIDTLFIENNIFSGERSSKENIMNLSKRSADKELFSGEHSSKENTRLKIYFKYQLINYIIYYPYECFNNNKNNNIEETNYYLPFPIFTKEIIDNFKNDIILPYYTKIKNKKEYYSLFQMESKDILLTCINEIQNEELFQYFNLIKTPFNDFGILYNVPVKLIWILVENNINIETFESFYLKFLSVYFCEKEFDIKEHFIKMDNNDLDKIFISERMKSIMNFN